MITKEGYKRLFNFLIWCIVAIFISIIGISNVFAWDWTNANGITYTAVGYVTNDTQIQIEVTYETNNGAPLPVSVNQQVYTQIKTLYINLDNYTFLANTRYELELNLPGLQLTGANSYSVTGYNGEQCMISLSDSVFVDEYPRWDFQCPTATTQIAISIYNSNQSPITEYGYFSWSYSHLYVSNMQINSSTTNNNDLIENANQNADRIINNQNENTDREIESQKVCNYIDKNNILQDNKALNLNGSVVDLNNWGLTDYIKIDNSTIKVLEKASSSATYFCFYNINKSKISCYSNNSLTVNDYISIPNNSTYVRFSISTLLNQPQLQICTNGNQAISDSVNDLNDSINNDDIDDNGIGSAFEDFDDFLDDNSTITQLITLPITLYTAILNNLNGTCQPFNLGELFGEDLILPCINISQYLGSSLWSMIDIIISAFAIFRISKKMIKVFNNFSSLREGDVIDD